MTTSTRHPEPPMARLEQWHTHDFDEQAALLTGWLHR